MNIRPSNRIASIGSYAFADVDIEVAKLKKKGIAPIDFGVGDPTTPAPELVREAAKKAIDKHKSSGYPSYIGSLSFRQAIADWCRKRFNVKLDPEKDIVSNIGSKEAVFNFSEAFVNPSDYVLTPNPGYPPYERGTLFAEGRVHYLNLIEEDNFFPDFNSIPKNIVKKAKVLWVNYPNSPTGKIATDEFFKEVIDFGHDNNIIVASDEAYTEIYFKERPKSILEFSKEGVVVVNSLSKRSAMTGYRVGWLAGDENIIKVFSKLKTNIDSGTPNFVQEAAIAAYSDEKHVEKMRDEYRQKMKIMVDAFKAVGLPDCTPEATIYIWQKVNSDSVKFAKKLLQEKIAVVVTPGNWLSAKADGINPGDGYIRLALVPSIEDCRKAAERIKAL